METINLNEKRGGIIAVGYKYYDQIMSLTGKFRNDEKPRTGIQIFVREPGTRNLMIASIYKPSEAAQFFAIEKAVRSRVKLDWSSQNSEDPDAMEFRGSVMAEFNGITLQASVSGLTADEDTNIAVRILAYLFKVEPRAIIDDIINHDGELPYFFTENGHYLEIR